jgi:hypothetical protein
MKTKSFFWLLLILGLTGSGLLLRWRGIPNHSTVAAISPAPPTDRLRAFAATNTPRTATGASWSTNQMSDPLKAHVMQQVAASVRTGQTNGAPASSPTTVAGFRDANQTEALRRLQEHVGSSLHVYLRTENNTPN